MVDLVMPYAWDSGQTHYDGCYRAKGHHNCAVARVDKLESVIRALAEDAFQNEIIDTGDLENKIGPGKEYYDKEDYIDSWISQWIGDS